MIESTARHDPYINRKFIDLMNQPEMVLGDFTDTLPEFEAAVLVGLGANDPARTGNDPIDRTEPPSGGVGLLDK